MSISELRQDIGIRLVDFAWGQWAQMGLLVDSERSDNWSADPEALLLLSFELGRDEPRLFEEVLDWLSVNERLVSVQRLRNLALDDEDRALVGAVVDWVSRSRKPTKAVISKPGEEPPEAFFRNLRVDVSEPDPAFLAHGFLKQRTDPDRRSGSPNLASPINFAFRMRSLLGVGARAEVMRVLLGEMAPRLSAQAIAASTAYAKRNVQEALTSLRLAEVIASTTLGNEQRFEPPRQRWAQLLELEQFPMHVDWAQHFHALRLLLRWLRETESKELTEYMLGSEARALLERIAPDLLFAGVRFDAGGPSGAAYWEHFAQLASHLPPR